MDQKGKMKADLIKEIDGYLMQLVYIKDLIDVEKDIEKNEEKMQRAPNFTLITKCALTDSYMLALMRLYDKGEKPKTIPNLIKKCKANIVLFPSADDTLRKLEEFERKIKEDEYIPHTIKVLITRRDSSYAHNDKQYFGEKLQNDKTILKKYHIHFLTNFTEEVLVYLFSQLSADRMRETKYNKDLEKLL